MKPLPQRPKIIDDLISGITPQVVAWKHEAPLSTVYAIKNSFLECFYRLKKHVPDPNQLSFPFMFDGHRKDSE